MRPSQIRPALASVGFSLALVAAVSLAQAQPPAGETAGESFGERVDVEVVNVDVIVTDREDSRVLDLGRDDFELLVDGRPVAIEYFAAPRLAGAAVAPPALAPERIPELAGAPAVDAGTATATQSADLARANSTFDKSANPLTTPGRIAALTLAGLVVLALAITLLVARRNRRRANQPTNGTKPTLS